MRRAHSAAVRIEQNPHQQAWFIAGLAVGSVDAVAREYGLNIVPKRLIDHGRMLARVALALMDDFTTINPVLQHQVQRAAGEVLTAIGAAIGGRPDLADNAGAIEILLQFAD